MGAAVLRRRRRAVRGPAGRQGVRDLELLHPPGLPARPRASCRTTASGAPATAACSTSRPGRRSTRRRPCAIKTYPVKEEDGEIFVAMTEAGQGGGRSPPPGPEGLSRGPRAGTAAPSRPGTERGWSRPATRRSAWPVRACSPTAATPSTRPWRWPRCRGWRCPASAASAVTRSRSSASRTVGSGPCAAAATDPTAAPRTTTASAGSRALPLDGALAVAVPGEVAALEATLHAGATRSLAELWAPAAELAERGMPCTVKTREDMRRATPRPSPRDPGCEQRVPAGRRAACRRPTARAARARGHHPPHRCGPGLVLPRRVRRARRRPARRPRRALQRGGVAGERRGRRSRSDHRRRTAG